MNGRKKRNKIVWLILTLSIFVIVVARYRLWEIRRTYQEGDDSYKTLAGLVRVAGSSVFHTPEMPGGSDTQGEKQQPQAEVEIPNMEIDFAIMKAVNPDAAAWIYCPDTPVDYPIVWAGEYDYYIDHLPDGTYNAYGTLFIDYHNAPDFTDKLTVVYGHNMKTEKMFGTLMKYKEQSYFAEHPYLYLYTERGNCRIDLLYGCVIGEGQWSERAFMDKANVESLLTYAASNTTFTSDVEYIKENRVIALSTCSSEFDDARYVVIGLLRPEYGDDLSTERKE